MSIRERQIASATYSAGNTSLVDLPRDAVYHILSLSCFAGTFSEAQGTSGTGSTFVPGFPFTLMRQIRLLRNGSDVVWSGSGSQLAKEHYYLNKAHPRARLYKTASNVETLRTATTRGITIPANSDGIGACGGGFGLPSDDDSTQEISFDFQADLWLQNPSENSYYATLIDARKLATYQLEITWATAASQIAVTGTAATAQAASFSVNVMSLDQDNIGVEKEFGTYKRSQLSYSNLAYGSQNNQVLLPRGNFFGGIIFNTRAFKAGSTANAIEDNAVIQNIENRINSNFSLRKVDFRQLQAKNQADAGGRAQPWSTAQGEPQGWAYMDYLSAAHAAAELVPTYVMDQFDLQLSTFALASSQNGVTTASTNPIIDLLLQEVIPGVSVGGSAPRGAQAGSISATSAKPYSR